MQCTISIRSWRKESNKYVLYYMYVRSTMYIDMYVEYAIIVFSRQSASFVCSYTVTWHEKTELMCT